MGIRWIISSMIVRKKKRKKAFKLEEALVSAPPLLPSLPPLHHRSNNTPRLGERQRRGSE